jgi:hypothetical protein
MASLPTTVPVISTYRHSTWTPAHLPGNANAESMQQQCNSSGGLCKRSANRVQLRCKSLNTARAARAPFPLADTETLEAFCSVRPVTAGIAWS